MSKKLPVTKIQTHVPSLIEVQKVLDDGLKKNFDSVSVNVVDCPDLTKAPFHLSSEGLCGSPRLADIGGPLYLLPLVQRDKIYHYKTIAEHCELPHAFMIGAGAGPAHVIGVNSELMNNVKYECDGHCVNNAYIARVDTQTGGCILEQPGSEEFCLMGNFLVCEGKPGKVIEVKASKRSGDDDFMASLRNSLKDHYGDQVVGLGGVFLVEKGTAHLHIMPDFSETPLTSSKAVDNWLKFYDFDPTLICVGELVSHDPGKKYVYPVHDTNSGPLTYKGLDLRVEHFHCFSKHGQGGHYWWDTTPQTVEYRGYFVLPEYLYRIDQPPQPLPL